MQEEQKDLLEAVAVRARYNSTQEAADELGIPRTTLRDRLNRARELGVIESLQQETAEQEDIDNLVKDLPDYHQVKRRLSGYNRDYINDFHSSRHINLEVPHKTFIQFYVGDLHRDSPGHDDDQFEADMGVIRRAQAEFPCHVVNMGDILDNWPTGGRLGKKHHDSHLTRTEALSLVRGFLQEEGINFTAHLLGNHDEWPGIDFATLLRQWTDAPVVDWAAYLHVITDQGWRFDTFAAHDMPGHSIHNSVHALARRAKDEGECDLYVAAHRHKGGQAKSPNGYRGKTYNFLRVCGYKKADEYAWAKGFPEEDEGATAVAVINPNHRTKDGRCRTFYDLEEGLDWARFIERREKE